MKLLETRQARKLRLAKTSPTLAQRFWAKVNKNGPIARPELTPCWLWTAFTRDGYGRVSLLGRISAFAHHVSWFLVRGEWPEYLCHECDVPACVNPDHLFLGNPRINVQDKLRKKRGRWLVNEEHGRCKYSNSLVRKMRVLYAKGKSIAEIGRRSEVPYGTASAICRGRIRKLV